MVQTTDELLTVREAAAVLKVSPYTIYRWVAAGRLPAIRRGRRVLRLRRSDLDSAGPERGTTNGPPKGSPQAILKMAGTFRGDDFRKAMDDVLSERTMTDFRSPFDELPD